MGKVGGEAGEEQDSACEGKDGVLGAPAGSAPSPSPPRAVTPLPLQPLAPFLLSSWHVLWFLSAGEGLPLSLEYGFVTISRERQHSPNRCQAMGPGHPSQRQRFDIFREASVVHPVENHPSCPCLPLLSPYPGPCST